jgi:zinc/manganese transport system substrate-binding protein/manganese/iron transport system substrate-binding protein
MRKLATVLAPVLLGLVALVACGGTEAASGAGPGGRIRAVATTTQTADFLRALGGGRLEIYDIVRPNIDPHDFEPSPADIEAVRNAQVIVKNGLGLEKFLDDVTKAAGSKAPVVDASAGVQARTGGEGETDPHIWQSPVNAKLMVTTIADALAKADPVAADAYAANKAAYLKQLDALDERTKAQIATLTNKKLVTNHDAFGYYVERYGLELIGSVIPSFDTATEVSGKDIQDLVAKIKATGVKAIFSESAVPSKTAETIAKEAGVTVVAGADSLFGDSLGPAGSDADTYIKMIDHNTRTIVENLR